MLTGAHGPATKMAMSIVAQMAEVLGASALLEITAAHIDSTIYVGQASLEFSERLADLGARVAVPSTLNITGVDEHHWQEWPVPADWAASARRQMAAYASMGTIPTWTCAPYQTEYKPSFGQQVAWGESNAIAYANSVLGARTERYPDLLDICCAITGRVPAVGLHLTENRAGEALVNMAGIPKDLQADDSFYPVLGHLLGKAVQDRIPVVTGIKVQPTEDQFKALCAAAATSGTVALFHMVGITPEAPTPEAAFQGRTPSARFDLTLDDLRAARQELTTTEDDGLDMVILGCPHFSLEEFRRLVPLIEGKRTHPSVRFLVTSNRGVIDRARKAGYLSVLEAFGGQITVDCCPLTTPMLPAQIKAVMTDSGKHAYYAPGLLNTHTTLGTRAECVQSAIAGHVMKDSALWQM